MDDQPNILVDPVYLHDDAHDADLEEQPYMDGVTSHVNTTLHMEANDAYRRNMATHVENEKEGIMATRTVGEEIER
jgi:hypothetical protein